MKNTTRQHALKTFRQHGGVLRTSSAIELGIHPRGLYTLRDEGVIKNISRGLYCLADHKTLDQPDLVAASLRVPKGVICLISALAFHNITTQIPHKVSMAIPRTMSTPTISYPPMQFYLYRKPYFKAGIEQHKIEKIGLQVYGPEKTVADCFRFRNQIGMDTTLEALRLCRERKNSSPRKLLHYARICRVDKIMTPYLEAIL